MNSITPENLPVGCLVRIKGRRGPWCYLGDVWFGPKDADLLVLRPLIEGWAEKQKIVASRRPGAQEVLHYSDDDWMDAYRQAYKMRLELDQKYGCWGDDSAIYVFNNQWITILKEKD